jgi:hypothetical protein
MNTWFLLIAAHTVVATVCFIAGLYLLFPNKAKYQGWVMGTFISTLLLMNVFMIGATLAHWLTIPVAQRITFLALAALGLYMFYRSLQAGRLYYKNRFGAGYFDAIGFVLIGLFDGFAIVSLLDLKMPVWIFISGGVIAIFLGRYFVTKAKHHFLADS